MNVAILMKFTHIKTIFETPFHENVKIEKLFPNFWENADLRQHFEDNLRFTVRKIQDFRKFPNITQLQMVITFLFMKRF